MHIQGGVRVRVELGKQPQKYMALCNQKDYDKINETLGKLENPQSLFGKIRKLQGRKDEYRISLPPFRIIFKIDKEVQKISDNPFRCHVYLPSKKLKYEYRVLHIKNYSLFYVVEKEKIEIHRVIYSKRDILQILAEEKY